MADAQSNLATMTLNGLLALHDEIGAVLNEKRLELETQLQRLTGDATPSRTSLKGIKVAPKYRGPNGETWAGRGMMPRWLTALRKAGSKPEKFLIAKPKTTAATRKRTRARTSGRKRS
jgi:DNA-binding protein H-NS